MCWLEIMTSHYEHLLEQTRTKLIDDALNDGLNEKLQQLTDLVDELKTKKSTITTINNLYPQWLAMRRQTINKLTTLDIDVLYEIQRKVATAKTVSTAADIASTAVMATGVVLAPFTLGASIGLIAVGSTGMVASTATSVIASEIKEKKEMKKMKEFQVLCLQDKADSEAMQAAINEISSLQDVVIEEGQLKTTDEFTSRAMSSRDSSGASAGLYLLGGVRMALGLANIVNRPPNATVEELKRKIAATTENLQCELAFIQTLHEYIKQESQD